MSITVKPVIKQFVLCKCKNIIVRRAAPALKPRLPVLSGVYVSAKCVRVLNVEDDSEQNEHY